MLAKYWKKICILILIIACSINVIMKLIEAKSLEKDLKEKVETKQTIQSEQENENNITE